jgi:hypothetical protein
MGMLGLIYSTLYRTQITSIHGFQFSAHPNAFYFYRILEVRILNSNKSLPEIKLIHDNMVKSGLQGSYSWNGVFIDKLLPSKIKESSERITLRKGINISFKVTKHIAPDEFQVSVFKHNQIVLKSTSTSLNLMLEEGKYVIATTAFWKGKGDVSFLFPIEVT